MNQNEVIGLINGDRYVVRQKMSPTHILCYSSVGNYFHLMSLNKKNQVIYSEVITLSKNIKSTMRRYAPLKYWKLEREGVTQ